MSPPAQAVKGLNKGEGRKRFVFKSFSQRIEEVDVDVFRSLAPIKPEPTSGSSFFHESLIAWRELNSAAEFTAVYEELLPLVQTMPQLVLHKELIMDSLLSRLHLNAILSSEPILNLVATLARDLREDFIPFMPRFLSTCVGLFQSGGDREPALIEQVFTCVSYIFKYLQKLLAKDTTLLLKATTRLRYYRQSYIQEFAAEAVSYILRNTSLEQLVKGMRRIIAEVVCKPLNHYITSCSSLLWYTIKGPGVMMHSRAEPLLRLLLDKSTFRTSTKKDPGGEVIVRVLSKTFIRLCEELERKKLTLLWNCLLDEIDSCLDEHEKGKMSVAFSFGQSKLLDKKLVCENHHALMNAKQSEDNGVLEEGSEILEEESESSEEEASRLHLINLLCLLNDVLEYKRGSQVSDFEVLLHLSHRLLKLGLFASKGEANLVNASRPFEASMSQLLLQVLRFILGLVKSVSDPVRSRTVPFTITTQAQLWSPLWNCQQYSSLVYFIQGLLDEGSIVLQSFMPYLLRLFNDHIGSHSAEVLLMMMDFFDKLGVTKQHLICQEIKLNNLVAFVQSLIIHATERIQRNVSGEQFTESKPALVWGALNCYPHLVLLTNCESSLSWNYCIALKQLLLAAKGRKATEEEVYNQEVMEFMLASALACDLKIFSLFEIKLSTRLNEFVSLAIDYRHSPQILENVAEYFDLCLRSASEDAINYSDVSAELQEKLDLSLFETNLGSNNKLLRLSTLRLLVCFQPFFCLEQVASKRRKGTDGRPSKEIDNSFSSIFGQLKSLEAASLNLDSGRQSSLLLTGLKVKACAGHIPEQYIIPITHAVIGILHNRFKLFWDASIDCLAGLLDMQLVAVWETFVHHLESYQKLFLLNKSNPQTTANFAEVSDDLQSRMERAKHDSHDSTDAGTLVTLLLRALQKIPKTSEARTRQLVPLFLTFVGHNRSVTEKSSEQNSLYRGKDWKIVLKEWLNLFSMMKNAQSYFQGATVKEVIFDRFLMDGDPHIQLKALECVLNWKDKYLLPYEEHLRNLISAKTSREEMTTWNIARDSEVIETCHREGLVPVLLRLLFPKILKTKSRLHNKTTGGVQRKVVLSFLGHLDVEELAYFFVLLLKPLETAFTREGRELIHGRHAWELAIERGVDPGYIEWLDVIKVANLAFKRKAGFLHMVKDVLETFEDGHIGPYLNALMAFVFRILQTCQFPRTTKPCCDTILENGSLESSNAPEEHNLEVNEADKLVHAPNGSCVGNGSNGVHCKEKKPSMGKPKLHKEKIQQEMHVQKQSLSGVDGKTDLEIVNETATSSFAVKDMTANGARDLRTLVFRILMVAFNKYDCLEFGPVYWDIFFDIVRPLISKFGQEGASSGSPSALFSCFLAMSRSFKLVLVLQQEHQLVPNLVSLLSHKNSSTSIVGAALSFVENIIELESEEAEIVSKSLLPHLPQLLSNIQAFLSSQRKLSSNRKFSVLVKRGLGILIRLSKYIRRPVEAAQLLDVLLPFLSVQKKDGQEGCLEILLILKELVPCLDHESCEKLLPFLGPQLASNPHQDVRLGICEVLSALSTKESSLASIAHILSELNAMSMSSVGEYDFDRRSQAYANLSASSFCSLTYNQALMVVGQAVYDVKSDDISIRHSSSNFLSVFIQFLGSVCSVDQQLGMHPDSKSDNAISSAVFKCVSDSSIQNIRLPTLWNAGSVKVFVKKVLFPNVRKWMGSDSFTVRREWVSLLRDMSMNLHNVSPLDEFFPLASADAEVDFFNNITHIQTHRRIRAMAKFKETCNLKKFSQGTLVRVFVPLFMSSLLEGKGDKDGNLIQSAVETVASIASQLSWDPYYSLLMQIIHRISSNPEAEKLWIKLLCSVLDKFHFPMLPDSSNSIKDVLEDDGVEKKLAIKESYIEVDQEFGLKGNPDDDTVPEDSNTAEEIQRQLQKRVLPEFSKFMVSKSNIINVSVALAIVKVLQLMPKEVMEVELPRIVQNIVNLLRNRSQAVRDEARTGLLAVMGVLGAGYVGFIMEKLQQTLKRGYELHVLGFTLNSIISKVFPTFNVGEIDYCAEKILDLLGNDIFEDVAEEREVEKIAFKMKETKKTGSFESVRLVAQAVTFHVHGATLLKPVRMRLKDAVIPKIKSKIERVLRQLALGIQSNLSMKQEELLIFVHGLVENGILEEKAAMKAATSGKMPMPSFKNAILSRSSDSGTTEKINSKGFSANANHHLIVEFALYLLEFHLKRAKLKKSHHAVLSMLDPFVPLLQTCLDSKHAGVLGLALRCLSYLLRLPLPSVGLITADLISAVLLMAEGFGRGESQVAQSCFNVLVALLKHAKGAHVTEEQLRLILQLPVFVDLGMAEKNTGLALLKAIIARKLLIPELYDMINRVSNLMVTSQAVSVQHSCSQIMLQFLLDYPLGPKRLQQHLDFFVTNLSYEHASGREAALEMLHSIIVKFPAQTVDEQSESLFLPLVTRLVNDDSSQIRAMIGAVLKVLMTRVSQRSLQRMVDFCFAWLRGVKHQLWRSAAQVLGFLIEVMKEKYSSYIQETLLACLEVLRHVKDANFLVGSDDRIGSALWQEAYYMLTMLEKLLTQFPELCMQRAHEELWDIMCAFLSHQHVWIQKACCRLLDINFTSCGFNYSNAISCPLEIKQEAFLIEPSRLMLLAAFLCQQLDSNLVDQSLNEQIRRVLLVVTCTLYSHFPNSRQKVKWVDLVSQVDVAAHARVLRASSILKVDSGILVDAAENQAKRMNGALKPNKRVVHQAEYHLLSPVFKRLEKISLRADFVQTKVIFDWYETISTFLGKEGVQPYLTSMLLPLHKIADGFASKNVSGELKTCAENVLNHLREVAGTTVFVEVFNQVRQNTRSIRDERKHAKKMRVLVDPEGNAKRKMRLTAKRQLQKKKRMKARKFEI